MLPCLIECGISVLLFFIAFSFDLDLFIGLIFVNLFICCTIQFIILCIRRILCFHNNPTTMQRRSCRNCTWCLTLHNDAFIFIVLHTLLRMLLCARFSCSGFTAKNTFVPKVIIRSAVKEATITKIFYVSCGCNSFHAHKWAIKPTQLCVWNRI